MRDWRRSYGYSQADIADKLKTSQPHVSLQEKTGRATIDVLQAYAVIYGVSVDDLLAGPPSLETQDLDP